MLRITLFRLFGMLLLASAAATAGDAAVQTVSEREIALPGGIDVGVRIYAAPGQRRLLWLLNDHGMHAGADRLARELKKSGVEVWIADLLAANFLTPVKSALEEIPDEQVSALIVEAARDGRALYLFASGRGALPTVRGAAALRAAAQRPQQLRGAVFISPNLYVTMPEPGLEADYVAVIDTLALPVFIIQPALSPWRWWIDRLSARLRAGDSPVRYVILEGVRGRFEFRPDASSTEAEQARRLPGLMGDAFEFLDKPQESAP